MTGLPLRLRERRRRKRGDTAPARV
ncbi:MAG: hypothetical protein J07HQX50_00385, partial [Haloquadratum sp. J07HQX50]